MKNLVRIFWFFGIVFLLIGTWLTFSKSDLESDPRDEGSDLLVYLDVQGVEDDVLKVAVQVDAEERGIFGAAFDLTFEPEKLEFLSYAEGDFLEEGGEPFYLVAPKKNVSGILSTGVTLKRGDQLVSGSGTLLELYFKIKNSGEVRFSFEKGVVATLIGGERQDIEKVEWRDASYLSGGML